MINLKNYNMKNYVDENRINLSNHLEYISEFIVNDYYDELKEKIENIAIEDGIIDNNWSDGDVNTNHWFSNITETGNSRILYILLTKYNKKWVIQKEQEKK